LIEFFPLIPTEFVAGFNERQRIRNLISRQELVICDNEDHFAQANHPIRSERDTSALIIGENASTSPMWAITSPNFMEVITSIELCDWWNQASRDHRPYLSSARHTSESMEKNGSPPDASFPFLTL
jgi:hypothetical protein